MLSLGLSDSQKIGMGLTGFGVFFLFFGMLLFFDKVLMGMGNLLFIAGLASVVGLQKTFRFLFQRKKTKATAFFLGGVLLVLYGWPLVGVALELYGLYMLFRGLLPVALGVARRVPVLGTALNMPLVRGFMDRLGDGSTMV